MVEPEDQPQAQVDQYGRPGRTGSGRVDGRQRTAVGQEQHAPQGSREERGVGAGGVGTAGGGTRVDGHGTTLAAAAGVVSGVNTATSSAAGGVPGCESGAGPETEPVADALDVRLGGAFGDGQLGCDLPVGQALCDQPGDLLLPGRQYGHRAPTWWREREEPADARGQCDGVADVGQMVAPGQDLQTRCLDT